MKWKFAVTYIVMSLFLINIVLAFDISSASSSVSLCPSTTELVTTTVAGSGTYSVNIAGSASQWTTSVPTGFSTASQKTVYTYITPPSNTLPGTYSLDINVNDGKSTKKSSISVNVLDCYKVDIQEVNSQTTCPGNIVKYDFNIKNTGKFQEAYLLSTAGSASPWVVLSQDKVDLASNQQKTVFAYATVPQEARGTHQFTLTSKSTLGTVSSSTAEVVVQGCFDYNIGVDKEFHSICDHSTLLVPITVTNTGTTDNTYNFELSGPTWAVLEKTSLTLKPGQKGFVNLIASPDYDVAGDYDISVTVVDKEGKQGFIQPLKINARDCHELSVSIEKDEDNVCAALAKTFNVDVLNNGEQKDKFNVKLFGPSWTSLDKASLELTPGQKETLKLTVNPPINEKESFDLNVLVESEDKGYSDEGKLNIKVLTQQQCYNPDLRLEENFVSVPQESPTTVPLTIENNGTQRSEFILGLSGTAATFTQLNPSTITLEPNTADTIYLYLAPTKNIGLGNYKAKITVKLDETNILDTETLNIEITEPQLGQPEEPPEESVKEESFWSKLLKFLFGIPEVTSEENKEIEEIVTEDDVESLQEEEEEVEDIKIEEEPSEPVLEEKTEETPAEKTAEKSETKEGDFFSSVFDEEEEEKSVEKKAVEDKESILNKLLGKKERPVAESTASLGKANLDSLVKYRNHILIAVIAILVVVLGIKYRKELLDFFTEEEEEFEEEDEKPKKSKKKK
ncbi:hypothetical protein J4414_03645 [Candidatus Woesearchaeota archaeon]|nr:hypothetical protein [Candidatus Woesearchaeota archaeon]